MAPKAGVIRNGTYTQFGIFVPDLAYRHETWTISPQTFTPAFPTG